MPKKCKHDWEYWTDPCFLLTPWLCTKCGAWESRDGVPPPADAFDVPEPKTPYKRPPGKFPLRLLA